MGGDGGNNNNSQNTNWMNHDNNDSNHQHNYDSSSAGGFEGYQETTLDPGPWLLLITIVFCFVMMLVVVPLSVHWRVQRRRAKRKHHNNISTLVGGRGSGNNEDPVKISPVITGKRSRSDSHNNNHGLVVPSSSSWSKNSSPDQKNQQLLDKTTTPTKNDDFDNTNQSTMSYLCSIWSCDKESRKILQLAIPHSVNAVASSTLSNLCLILISQNIGTKPVAAYCLVQVLAGLTNGILQGPIYACTTVCSQAIGAGNTTLAGSFIQLSLLVYAICYIPVVYFWWYYMYEIIKYLEWGDEGTALMAQDFIRVYVFSYILGGVSLSVWQLLEITNHAIFGTVISIAWGLTNVLLIGLLTTTIYPNGTATLSMVAYIYNATSVLFIGATLVICHWCGWLKPFTAGLFGQLSFTNPSTVKLLLKQAVPLAVGSLLSNAEWAVLTVFASQLGPAEVAAWALLGSLWEVFYASTAGIGDAAEIRLAFHLGNNNPTEAQRCAYKALSLGMLVASVISVVYFSLQSRIPGWFTSDATLQAMLEELVPFVGVANLTMTFGMQCWSLIGAQGKYKLATWISFISSWGVVMPLAAFFVFVLRLDLQGLTAASCVGYLSTGSALSYVLLSTNWPKVARKIHHQNCDYDDTVVTAGNGSDDEDDDEGDLFGGDEDVQLYAAMRHRSDAARRTARGNIRLLMIPGGHRSGIVFGNARRRQGTYVVTVRPWSVLKGVVNPGDAVLALDGVNVSQEDAKVISNRLKSSSKYDRFISLLSPPNNDTENNDFAHLNLAEDDSSDAPFVGKLSASFD